MMCTEFQCGFTTKFWEAMKLHYKKTHPEIKRPDKLFTKEARSK